MNSKTIIALNYKHLAYATQAGDGSWSSGTASIEHRTIALAVAPHKIQT